MRRRSLAVGALAAATALLVSACGGGSSSSSGGGGGASTALDGVGPITLVQGKDVSGFVQGILDSWNAQHADQKATLIELPEDADAQRQQMIQNANAKSDAYSVLVVDNVWTAEFAANRYITELPQDQFPMSDFLPPVIASAEYKDKLYAVPNSSDGGMLYYRTDLLQAAGIASASRAAAITAACSPCRNWLTIQFWNSHRNTSQSSCPRAATALSPSGTWRPTWPTNVPLLVTPAQSEP